jgi:hypothetical protein
MNALKKSKASGPVLIQLARRLEIRSGGVWVAVLRGTGAKTETLLLRRAKGAIHGQRKCKTTRHPLPTKFLRDYVSRLIYILTPELAGR